MRANRLEGKRWFGVVKKAFIACPNCAKVHRLSDSVESKRRGWSPRTQKLACECGNAYYIGMLAWRSKGGRGAVPIDNVPRKEEAEALQRLKGEMIKEEKGRRESRAQYRNVLVEGIKRRKGDQVNVIIDKGEEEK